MKQKTLFIVVFLTVLVLSGSGMWLVSHFLPVNVDEHIIQLLIIFIFYGLLCSFMAYWLTRKVNSLKIKNILMTIFKIEEGHLNARTYCNYHEGTIGLLAQAIDRMAFSLQMRDEELKRLVTIDDLTQIYNRRFFLSRAEEEIDEVIRYHDEISLILLDIDKFKEVNDTYGHQTGDMVLKEIARHVQGVLRKNDIFARYGGEEFIVLMPKASQEKAKIVANRILELVRTLHFTGFPENRFITVSLGLVTWRDSFQNLNRFISSADDALYLSKKNGRNQITIAS